MNRSTILVTGASGFIGGRVVEVLHGLDQVTVRAGIRRWSAAARVGRLPVELVRCDITQPGDVAVALKGVTHIVHCAVGNHTVCRRSAERGGTGSAHLDRRRVWQPRRARG
jgi:uncharacterized protein YbjT (DUF2867 family)